MQESGTHTERKGHQGLLSAGQLLDAQSFINLRIEGDLTKDTLNVSCHKLEKYHCYTP